MSKRPATRLHLLRLLKLHESPENIVLVALSGWSHFNTWRLQRQAHQRTYKMVNPIQHMEDMKLLMRGEVAPWQCRAGQNSLIIPTDGSLAPCFPMYSATHDWGVVGDHQFEVKQLDEMKKDCTKHCLSTCNCILGYCYDNMRVTAWALKQAMNGFRGSTGSF